MHMKIYRQQYSDQSIAALEDLVGSEIGSILSPWCDIDYGSSLLLTSHLSIGLEPRKFLILENDWSDTPIEYHDYYFMEAKIANVPLDINVKDEGNEHLTYITDHITLRLGGNSVVNRVSVLEDEYIGEKEGVLYDAGILIEQDNGNKVAIIRQESITGFFEIAHSKSDIESLTKDLKVRVELNA